MAAPSGRRPLGQGFIRMIPVKVPVQSTGPEADLEVGAENAQPPEQSRQRAKRAHSMNAIAAGWTSRRGNILESANYRSLPSPSLR